MPIKAVTSKDSVTVHPGISGNPIMATLISSVRALGLILLTSAIVSGLPTVDVSTKLTETSDDTNDENSTLALDLVPPSLEDTGEKNVTLFIINLYAVKNHSGEGSEEMLDNTLQEKMPDIIGPLATIFLVVEDGEDEEPVDLDKMAIFMEERGFKMDKIEESGETSVLRTEVPNQELDDLENILESTSNNSLSEKSHKSKKYRVRRMACKKCHHGGGGGGYGGGKGGGGGYGGGSYQYYEPNGGVGVIPVYVVPVSIQTQPVYRPQYHPQPAYHPSGGGCDPCQGGGGGGRGGGGGGAWATASAGAGSW